MKIRLCLENKVRKLLFHISLLSPSCPSQPEWDHCPAVCSVRLVVEAKQLFHVYCSSRPELSSSRGNSLLATVLPFAEGGYLVPFRREPPGVRELSRLALRAEEGERVERARLALAVDGGTVCFGFPCWVNYSHKAVSKLFQDHPLCFNLRLVSLFRPLGLLQQTLARRLQHLLRYERIREPAGDENKTFREGFIILHVNKPALNRGTIHSEMMHCDVPADRRPNYSDLVLPISGKGIQQC